MLPSTLVELSGHIQKTLLKKIQYMVIHRNSLVSVISPFYSSMLFPFIVSAGLVTGLIFAFSCQSAVLVIIFLKINIFDFATFLCKFKMAFSISSLNHPITYQNKKFIFFFLFYFYLYGPIFFFFPIRFILLLSFDFPPPSLFFLLTSPASLSFRSRRLFTISWFPRQPLHHQQLLPISSYICNVGFH